MNSAAIRRGSVGGNLDLGVAPRSGRLDGGDDLVDMSLESRPLGQSDDDDGDRPSVTVAERGPALLGRRPDGVIEEVSPNGRRRALIEQDERRPSTVSGRLERGRGCEPRIG